MSEKVDEPRYHGGSAGPSTDRHNDPVVDPTKNVLDLVEQAIKRQDDLRQMEASHFRELIDIRATHTKEMRKAEAERIDAIRAVDVGNVQRAAEVQAQQAATLATQVAQSAEAMRSQVSAAASAASIALAAALEPVQKDIADLRRAQYEAQGQKAQVVETRAGSGAILGYVVGAVSLVGFLITLVVLLTQGGGTTP